MKNKQNLDRHADCSGREHALRCRNHWRKKSTQELLPALGVGARAMESSSTPELRRYAWSCAHFVAHEAGPNKDAIKMLEKAVGLDPICAGVGSSLERYYFDAIYANGGSAQYERSMLLQACA